MSSVASIIIIIIASFIGLIIAVWILIQLFDFMKYIFPTSNDDEIKPF